MKRFLFFLFLALPLLGLSQQYKLSITNIHQPNGMCNQLEFDIYVQNVSTDTLYLCAFQGGIDFNYAGISNGGTITGAMQPYDSNSSPNAFVPGSSTLSAPQNNCNWNVNYYTHQIRCIASLQTTKALAAIIPTTSPGIKLGSVRLKNTVPFTNASTPDLSWSFLQAANKTKTSIAAWVNGGINAVNLTTQTSFNYSSQGPECFINGNPSLVSNSLSATVSTQVYPESCNLSGDGAVDVTITPPGTYSYLWSSGAVTEDVMNLVHGTYALSVQNTSGGCFLTTINVPISGSNCGTVYGHIFSDFNNDCIYNGVDLGAPNVYVQLSNGTIAMSNLNGNFVFNTVNYGDYGINTWANPYYSANACVQPDSVHLTSLQPSANIEYKELADSNFDMIVSISGQTLVPGFVKSYYLYVTNYSAMPASSSTISFVVNNALVLDSATPGYTLYTTAAGDSLVWNTSFLPYQLKSYIIKTLVPVSTPLGMSISCWGHVILNGQTDINLTNNNYCRTVFTTGSFDPNDKQVNPPGVGPNGIITLSDSVLDYTIQFQNTGTAEAINVSVMDTLSNKLDWNSFEVISASHPYMILIPTPGVFQFKFNNILLPDSNTNEPLSHGYITYRIKQKNTNVIGDVIQNKAYITFDFNAPVITNTTTNTIGMLNPLGVLNNEEVLPEIYPNPVSNELTLSYSTRVPLLFELFDVTGRKVYSNLLPTEKFREQISLPTQLRNGIYQYRFSSSEQQIRTGKIEIRR